MDLKADPRMLTIVLSTQVLTMEATEKTIASKAINTVTKCVRFDPNAESGLLATFFWTQVLSTQALEQTIVFALIS